MDHVANSVRFMQRASCMRCPRSFVGLALVCLMGGALPAHSQISNDDIADIETPLENESVIGRSRPEYDAIGIPLGAFRAFPTANLSFSYDDNVLRTDSNAEHDYIIALTPGIAVRSDWVRHYLAARASATRYKYFRHSSESRTEWNASAGGRLDILTGFNL